MKSFAELYEELGGMSATSLGTSVDGVLDPEDNRLPDRLGKVDKRVALKKKKDGGDDEVDEAKNVINEKPLKKNKDIASYRLIGDQGVKVTLTNGDKYSYDHREPRVWSYTKKPTGVEILVVQKSPEDIPKSILTSVHQAFKDNNIAKDNPNIAMNRIKGKRL